MRFFFSRTFPTAPCLLRDLTEASCTCEWLNLRQWVCVSGTCRLCTVTKLRVLTCAITNGKLGYGWEATASIINHTQRRWQLRVRDAINTPTNTSG